VSLWALSITAINEWWFLSCNIMIDLFTLIQTNTGIVRRKKMFFEFIQIDEKCYFTQIQSSMISITIY
jgi:hypothetical protein